MPKEDARVDAIYKLIVEQTRDYAVFLLDREGNILTWNLGAQRIKGYRPDEIIGRHFSVFYTRDAVESGWPQTELKLATGEGRFEDEGWRIRKDGSRFWANVVITALRDENGKLLGFSKITRDLTERRLHEEQLRQSEERFRLLIDGVVDYAIFMLDPEGYVTSWNVGAERMTGYTRQEIMGKHFSRFHLHDDIDAGKPWDEVARARRTGRAEDEAWRVRKDGQRFWARVTLTALHDAEGRLRGYAKVVQDLSERRHLQQLEQTSRNVNAFIAMLAHELRNPLAPIRTAVQVMVKTPSGEPASDAMVHTIDRQSRHLTRIVDDLVDVSRILRGALAIKHDIVDLAEVVARAVETAKPVIEMRQHTLDVDLPKERTRVRGDSDRLSQLLANLLINAARYTPDRGRINLEVRQETGKACMRVLDNGQGIEPPMLERIFDMFVQADPLHKQSGGLGVGLALARRIAELHDGSLVAHSEGKDKGSEFTLRLPLAAATQSRERVAPKAPAGRVALKRVLVVDDNVDAAETMKELLQSLGHETRVVYDGAHALRAAEEFHPDVVLLDIGMPGLDGYEVARQLRTIESPSRLKIVAVTGWGHESDRERSQQAGFDIHLVKPVDMHELARVLEERNGASLH